MHDIVLEGCTPTPLAGYLKALGVLRLLSHKERDIRGYWNNDMFVLRTGLDRARIEHFFLHEYSPTPVLAPWNGGSGFFAKDNKDALEAIRDSDDPRLAMYRQCLDIADRALEGVDRSASPKNEEKTALQTRIRAYMPDDLIPWFDAAVSLTGDSSQYPPLLGTGGNDGRLDFTNNFMQRVLDVLGLNPKVDEKLPANWLAGALFARAIPGMIKSAIGQFSPGQVGGPNATTGFEAESIINPWDFVLMIEGALAFAGAVVRRHADDPAGVMSYPFTVRSVGAGSGAIADGDAGAARGELWMPLWPAPATYGEVAATLSEGRVTLGRRPVRDALDFVRAVHRLGAYRGITEFQRYGLLRRSGKAYLATPLARVRVSTRPRSRWLEELETNGWLDRFRRFAGSGNSSSRIRMLRRRLEDRMFELSGRDARRAEVQDLMRLLGEIQAVVALSPGAQEAVPPVPRLSERWVVAADDGTPAFRIARALAGLRGAGTEPLPLRAQLFPVQRKGSGWVSAGDDKSVRVYTPACGRLTETLVTLLERRLWLAEKLGLEDKPLASPAGAITEDVAAFLRDDGMDSRIQGLLPGLSLCEIPEDVDKSAGEGALPAAYVLLKLAVTPDRVLRSLGWLGREEHLPVPAGMVQQLAAGNHANRAVEAAWRRLRASGLTPCFTPRDVPQLAGIDPLRAAAALLIPLRYGAVAHAAREILIANEAEPETV